MLAIHRPSAALFRAAARKGVVGRSRGPAPPVVIDQSPAGSQICCNFGEVALALRQPLDGGPATQIAVPGAALTEIEGGRQGIAVIEADDQTYRATWEHAGAPRELSWPTIDVAKAAMPSLPKTFATNDRTLLQASFECGKSAARDSIRFAMQRFQIHGRSGRIAGTDGRQLLMWSGFDFPFNDELLLPAVPIFGHRELAMTNEVRIGKMQTHVVVTAGPWTVWLLIDAPGRFPKVEQVVPRDTPYVLRLDETDRQKAAEFCETAVKVEDDPVAITVDLGPTRALRRKTGPGSPPEQLLLNRARSEGEPITFVLNRDHFLRGLSLGLREIRIASNNSPVVLRDERRTYVATTIVPSEAIPAIRVPATRVPATRVPAITAPATTVPLRRKQVIPINEGVQPMASETNGNGHGNGNGASHDTEPAEVLDFITEAEGLRDALFETARRSNRLVAMLKQLKKQRRVLETAWSSLKSLRLGS